MTLGRGEVALEAAEGRLRLRGELTFATAAGAYEQGLRLLLGGQAPQRLDLGGLSVADSAGLACVLALMAAAREQGRTLVVEQLPDGLRALAQVSDVADLLGEAG
jgi:phospholipid transport system transporter-binding protein